jgi:hypothetical protein
MSNEGRLPRRNEDTKRRGIHKEVAEVMEGCEGGGRRATEITENTEAGDGFTKR